MDRNNLARFCGIVGLGSGVLFWLAPIVALKLSFMNTVDVSSQFFWILLMLNLIVIYFGIKGFQTFKGDPRIKNGVRIFYLVAGILIFMPTLQQILPAIPFFQVIITILYRISLGTLDILPYFTGGSILIVCGAFYLASLKEWKE